MKLSAMIFLLTLVVACDPFGFGYKKNPAYVLDEAFKAVSNMDVESFVEVTGKEALCVYGNEKGLQYLRDNLMNIDHGNIKIVPKVLETRHLSTPVFTGNYWTYYQERYEVQIHDKINKTVLAETIVDCDFGNIGYQDDRLLNQPPVSYRKKECRAVKFIPKTFQSLPVSEKCGLFKIEL